MPVQWICFILTVFSAIVLSYYLGLAVLYLVMPKQSYRHVRSSVNSQYFAIVIPAHNEEKVLPNILKSCGGLDYPKDRHRVYVVADNCTDRTAAVARCHGVECLERSNDRQKGKGYALEWAFERILPHRWDAVVVLDADCEIDSQALRVLNVLLNAGAEVLQANDIAGNPDESAISYALRVGNIIENELFYAPKSALGLAVLLRGTGMVFRREVLEEYPWTAHSLAEDAEYSLRLIRGGKRITFVPAVCVVSRFPADARQMRVQRSRWAGGNLGVGRKQAARLILEGLRTRRGALVDAGWTLLVMSRPLVLMAALAALLTAATCVWLAPGEFSTGLLLAAASVVVGFVLYLAAGIGLLGMSRRRLTLLLRAPLVIGRLAAIALSGLVSGAPTVWTKTPRKLT
jgi:glycosyltransferase involved in cell wall biosynthesis